MPERESLNDRPAGVDDADTGRVIELVEERAEIGIRSTHTGTVRVRTETVSDRLSQPVELDRDRVEVDHVPVGEFVEAMPETRVENGVTIVPVVEEQIVVTKRLFLKEEVHIRRSRSTETVEVPVELKRQTVTVERLDADGTVLPAEEPPR